MVWGRARSFSPPWMSLNQETSKQAQVVQNYFTKCVQVIVESRLSADELKHTPQVPFGRHSTPSEPGTDSSTNRWFNLELNEQDMFKDSLAPWKHIQATEPPPPLVVECFLDPSRLRPGQTIVLGDSRCSTNQEIVLERWVIECQPHKPEVLAQLEEEPTHTTYKRAVVSMRALYTAARLLPTWQLHKKLERQKLISVPLKLGVRIHNGSQPISSRGRIGLSKQVAGTRSVLEQFGLQPVVTPLGTLVCGVTYRTEVGFTVEDIEKLMAQKFMEIDGPDTQVLSPQLPSSSLGPKPVLSFTRPFKSDVPGSAAGSAAGSATSGAPGIAIPTASSVSSTSSRFSSSFAPQRGTAASLHPRSFSHSSQQGSGSVQIGSHSSADLSDVNEFLRLVDDSRRSTTIQLSHSSADVDAQLERFQTMRQSHTQLSDSILGLETVRPDRRSSGSRSRLGFYAEEDDDMLFALGDMHI